MFLLASGVPSLCLLDMFLQFGSNFDSVCLMYEESALFGSLYSDFPQIVLHLY